MSGTGDGPMQEMAMELVGTHELPTLGTLMFISTLKRHFDNYPKP